MAAIFSLAEWLNFQKFKSIPENVTLQLIQSKCVPALLYGLDVCLLNKSDINSLDFAVNQFFMKLFCTSDINIVSECQLMFNFKIPSEQLAQRKTILSVDSTVCDV